MASQEILEVRCEMANRELQRSAVVRPDAASKMRRRPDSFRDEICGLMSGARDEASRSIPLLKEQRTALMSEAEAKHHRMKQATLEQQLLVESMRMHLYGKLRQARDIAATLSA